jgi:hypothetical protein
MFKEKSPKSNHSMGRIYHILPAKLMIYRIQREPREISQFGKKSAKVYHSLFSSTEQLQVAL